MVNRFRIILTPFPSAKDFFQLLMSFCKKKEIVPTSKWKSERDDGIWLSKSALSMAVIYTARKLFSKKEQVTICLPDYFCNSSLNLVRQLGANLIFYRIDKNMKPAADEIEQLIKSSKIDIFIFVHFFGRIHIPVDCIELCKRNDIWVIEDAAHVLFALPNMSRISDFVLFSPHKHLAIPDGAFLTIKNPNYKKWILDSVKELDSLQKEHFLKIIFQNLVWLLKRLSQLCKNRLVLNKNTFYGAEPTHSLKNSRIQISNISKRLLHVYFEKLNSIMIARNENEQFLNNMISNKLKYIHQKFVNNDYCYFSAICFEKELEAEEIFYKLNKCGIPVQTWPDLPPEVLNNAEHHKSAIVLAKTILFFPVHQSITIKEFITLEETFESALKNNC